MLDIDFGTQRPWKKGSSTQINQCLRCPSRWWFGYIRGLKEPKTLPMMRGSRLHAQWEKFTLTGEIPTVFGPTMAQVRSFADPGDTEEKMRKDFESYAADEKETFFQLIRYIPTGVARELVERRFVNKESYPVHFSGVIDLVDPKRVLLDDGREALRITDYKTTSALKWALLGPEIKSDPQACAYVAEIQRQTGWTGPIVFRLLYSTTKRPFVSESREATFEPHEIDDARAFIGSKLGEMLLLATVDDPKLVPFNVEACDDYKTKKRAGCFHRDRCASLGRPVSGEFDVANFQPLDLFGETPMSVDPLNALLQQTQTPNTDPLANLLASSAPTVDDARAKLEAKIRGIYPNAVINADTDLHAVWEAAVAEQTKLIVEITTLDPSMANDEARAFLRTKSNERLTEIRDAKIQPKPLAQMTLDEMKAEIMKRQPAVKLEHFGDKGTADLVPLLHKLRAQAATAGHATNSPENVSQTAPVDNATKAQETAPETGKPKVKKDPTRGARLPDEYGGELVTKETKKSGNMQRYLQAHGIPVPKGAGSTGKMKDIVAKHVSGVPLDDAPDTPPAKPPAPATPPSTPPASATQPALIPPGHTGTPSHPIPDAAAQQHAAQLAAAKAEIVALAQELGHSWDPSSWTVETVVAKLNELRIAKASKAAAAPAPAATEPETPQVVEGLGGEPGAFVLFVDCHPANLPAVDLARIIAPLGAAVAKAGGVAHYLSMPYSEGTKKVAALFSAKVATGELQLPAHIYVSSKSPSGPALVEALTPLAREIVRGDR